MSSPRKVILFIAMSLDGYIATKEGDLSFLSTVEKDVEDYGYSEFIKSVDTVILGRKTYDKVLTLVPEFPHKDKDCFILTRTPKPQKGNIKFYSGDLKILVGNLKSQAGKNIFVDGGGEIVYALLKDNLIDEFIISIIPTMLGGGISLFKKGRPETGLKLINSKHFDSGLVQLHYAKLIV